MRLEELNYRLCIEYHYATAVLTIEDWTKQTGEHIVYSTRHQMDHLDDQPTLYNKVDIFVNGYSNLHLKYHQTLEDLFEFNKRRIATWYAQLPVLAFNSQEDFGTIAEMMGIEEKEMKSLTDLHRLDQDFCRNVLWGGEDFALVRQFFVRIMGAPSSSNKKKAIEFLMSQGFEQENAERVINNMTEQGPPQKFFKLKIKL